MNKKKLIKSFIWILNISIIFILIWSIVNYKVLNREVTGIVLVGGLIAMIFLVILLEGAPVFVGASLVVAVVLTMNSFNPWFILFLFLVSAIIGNIIYFYIGYSFGKKIFKYFDKKDVEKYEKLFKKYGKATMLLMAVSPIPYLPTLAGVFRINSPCLIAKILLVRMIRHTIVFLFWFVVIIEF